MVGLAGTALGDLFVFGDIRDAVREGSRYVSGQPTDELVLGLSPGRPRDHRRHLRHVRRGGAGARRPVRGQGGAQDRADRRAAWRTGSAARCARWSTGRRCGAPAPRSPSPRPRCARRAQAVKVEKADGLMKLASDVGRVQTQAPARKAALDGLKLADGPRDMARDRQARGEEGRQDPRDPQDARAAARSCCRSRPFNLAVWILGAILTLFGFVSSAKSGVERLTQRAIDRGKERRQRARSAAMMAARGLDPRRCGWRDVAWPSLSAAACRAFHHGSVEIAYLDEGRGRADRAGARLRLDQRGELGAAGLGRDADAAPAGA